MLNLFAALANRYNSLELAGVLRSPYFGLDDENENMDGYSQEEEEEALKQMQKMQELLRQMTNKENMNN